MAPKQLKNNPLAEVFSFAADDFAIEAATARNLRKCRFREPHKVAPKVASHPFCTKVNAKDPLGVCSVHFREDITVICPIRFRERWQICIDAVSYFFPDAVDWTPLTEVRLNDAKGRSAGKIDIVVIRHDKLGKLVDFGAIEVQAVYISGNIRKPFTAYMKDPQANFDMDWRSEEGYPKPDYLSSSRKRLVPQLSFKGQILNAWGKKQIVAVDKPFFRTLPEFEELEREASNLCWLIYKLDDSVEDAGYRLNLDKKVYCGFESTMEIMNTPEPGTVSKFEDQLQKKLSKVLSELRDDYGVSSMAELLRKNKESTEQPPLKDFES